MSVRTARKAGVLKDKKKIIAEAERIEEAAQDAADDLSWLGTIKDWSGKAAGIAAGALLTPFMGPGALLVAKGVSDFVVGEAIGEVFGPNIDKEAIKYQDIGNIKYGVSTLEDVKEGSDKYLEDVVDAQEGAWQNRLYSAAKSQALNALFMEGGPKSLGEEGAWDIGRKESLGWEGAGDLWEADPLEFKELGMPLTEYTGPNLWNRFIDQPEISMWKKPKKAMARYGVDYGLDYLENKYTKETT